MFQLLPRRSSSLIVVVHTTGQKSAFSCRNCPMGLYSTLQGTGRNAETSYWFKCTDRVKYTVSTKLLSQQYFSTLYRSLCSSALVDSELTRPAGAASSLVCTACLEGTYGTGLVAPLQWMGIGCGGQCCRCSTFDIPDLSCPEFEESNCLCQRFTCWAVHRKKTSVCIQEAAHALCVLLDHILHQRVR